VGETTSKKGGGAGGYFKDGHLKRSLGERKKVGGGRNLRRKKGGGKERASKTKENEESFQIQESGKKRGEFGFIGGGDVPAIEG